MKLIFRLTRTVLRSGAVLAEILAVLKDRQTTGPKEEVWLDSTEVTRRLHITERTLYTYKTTGILKAHRIGRRDYYRESDIFHLP